MVEAESVGDEKRAVESVGYKIKTNHTSKFLHVSRGKKSFQQASGTLIELQN